MKVSRLLFRSDGVLRLGWFPFVVVAGLLALVLAVCLVALAFWLPIKVVLLEPSCNQRADELGVADGDYRLLSDACFLKLHDGTVIDADQYRATEGTNR